MKGDARQQQDRKQPEASALVSRFPRLKTLLIPSVFIAERLPFLLLGQAIFLLAPLDPQLTLVVFFVLLTWNAVGAGFNAVGMQELYARIIPLEKRGRLAGITGSIGIGLALVGALINRTALVKWAFPNSYALLFFFAGLSAFVAWIWLTQIREPKLNIHPPAQGFNPLL